MRKAPIEVTGLRPAPAIIVNPGDLVRILGRWYLVLGHETRQGCIRVKAHDQQPESVHVDMITEWRRE